MSATILAAPSRQLLEQLRAGGDNPTVPESERESAIGWLRCVLVDFTALNKHVALLQQLYGNPPFCFPSPRRDGGYRRAAAPPALGFRFTAVWPQERIEPILDGGPGVLKNQELGELILNPYALADLHDVISELAPETWLPTIHEVCRQMTQLEGVSSTTASPQTRLLPEERILATCTPGRVSAWRWGALSLLALATVLLIGFLGVLLTRALYGR
jgi:hypothetical protein